jgi:pimeloyl-ACP methyl ester carboxylesterase
MAFPGEVATKSVHVPHLGGMSVAYHLAKPFDDSKITLVLINGFTGTATQFREQVDDAKLVEAVNLIVVEPIGHGNTRINSPTYTLWDSATAILQLLSALGIEKFVVLGTSMGGWVAARVALYAPERVSVYFVFLNHTCLRRRIGSWYHSGWIESRL